MPAPASEPAPDFRTLFESAPGLYLVLTPGLRIVAVSDAYLSATMTVRERILGQGLFEVFPDNPDDHVATGVSNLRASLERVIRNKVADVMAVQKYDIRRPASEGGGFEERHWSPVNSPIIGPDGEIAYIIHRVEDVTEFVRVKQLGAEQNQRSAALQVRAERMEAEIFQRAQQLQDVNSQLRQANADLARRDEERTSLYRKLSELERKKAEEALSLSEARFHQLAENIPEVFWMATSDMSAIIYASPAYAGIWGRSVDDLYRDPREWLDAILPEDRARVSESLAKIAHGASEIRLDYRIRRPDGSIRWISDRAFPVRDADGLPYRSAGIAQDVTDHKRAEERFRIAVEASPNGMIMVDSEGRILLVNREIERMFGYSRDELLGQAVELLVPERFRGAHPGHRTVFQSNPHARAMGAGRELFGLRKDGTQIPIEIGLNPIRNEEGLLVLACVVDVSARQRAELDRRRLENQLRQAQKMEAIGQLAGGIAHDFNNILGCIIGYAELLEADVAGNEGARDCVSGVLDASQRAKDLVRRILTFSRRHDQERRPIALADVVADALKLLRASLPATIVIDATAPAGIPTVLADATQIQQIILNLGTNSAHAMQGRGQLDVQLSAIDVDVALASASAELRPGPYVRLSVTDTGCGMDRETLQHAFEPFFTTKSQGEGTGLGLAVVHGIVKSHDGAVAVYSEPGQGTSFHIYFPAHDAAVAPARPETDSLLRGGGERILIVDDELQLATLGKLILERAGYRVTELTSPLDALAAFRAGPDQFDLVLLDLTMPQMTGLDLAGELLRLRPGLPVILVTGFGGTLTTGRAQALGIREVLSKPVTTRSLTAAVHRALNPGPGVQAWQTS